LQSVREVADEIIVADTGSTDRTEQIAKDFGATVVHFPWCDDFSAARNFAVSQAHGDWIFWLDADEELLPESVSELRSSMVRTEALAYFVRRQDLQDANRLDYFTTMWQLRLFRRREDLKFVGRCHPHFEPGEWEVADKYNLQVLQSSITMRHYGYVGELRPAKLQRGARLMELELADRPGQLYYMVEFGRTLLLLGQSERGHEILCRAMTQILPRLNDPEMSGPVIAQLLEYFLMLPAERLPAGLTAELMEDVTRRWFPSSAPLVWLLARRAAEAGQLVESERLLRGLLRMGADQSYDQWVSFDPRLVGCDAKLNLGVCLVRQNKVAEARLIFAELLTGTDRVVEAREYLKLIEPLGGMNYSFA
jgi:hypothetical protein